MDKGTTYRDGVNIPHPFDRCDSYDVEEREAKHSTLTHKCKDENKHPGQHKCICGRLWDPKEKANA